MKIDTSSFLMRSPFAQGDLGIAQPQPAVMPSMHASQSSTGFLNVFESAVLDVDARTRAASDRVAAVDAGHSDDMVGAMLASQEASLSFSMLMQVRNKLMGAVDEVVKLQV